MTLNSSADSLLIAGPAGHLEVRVIEAVAEAALTRYGYQVVICHPHPQHGGTFDNKVVTTLMRSYRDSGVGVVMFNFRGVGKSEGSFSQGRGELDDLRAVIEWNRTRNPGAGLLLAGFSFGSAIAAQASHELPDLRHLLLVAPPVERYRYERDGRFSCPVGVVIGEMDERVDVAGVQAWAAGLEPLPQLITYPEAGHFFHGHLTRLKTDVSNLLSPALAVGNAR